MNVSNKVSKVIKEYGIVLIMFITFAFFCIARPAFLSFSNIITITRQAAVVCICGLGMAFVLITGGIDLTVGWMMSFVGMFAAVLMTETTLNPIICVIIVFLAMQAVSAVVGLTIAKLHIAPFIVTMAFMNVLKGCAYLITSGKNIYGLPDSFSFIGQGYIGPIPVPIILMGAAILIAWFILKVSYFGRYFYAIGGNEEAALLSGINVTMTKVATYMLSGFFATFAGLVMLARIKTASPTTGNGYEMDVITACVLGGVSMTGGEGKIYHVVVGSMIIAILNNGLIIMQVSEYVQVILKGLVLLLAVIIDVVQRNSNEKKKVAVANKL